MNFQEKILLAIQSYSNPFLDFLFQLITTLGEEYLYIAIISFLFWNISKKNGFILALSYIFSMFFNEIIKLVFHTKRPFELNKNIRALRVETATGYSFPSGHTQGITTFLTTFSLIIRKWWFTIVSIILIISVAFSRLYLGVHWPIDVIGAILFGISFSLLLYFIIIKIYENKKVLSLFLIISSSVIFLTFIIILILNSFIFIEKLDIINLPKISGMLIGIAIGFLLENRFVYFKENGKIHFLILRYLIGLLTTLIIMIILKKILPQLLIFDFLRYFIIGNWIIFLYPLIGVKIGLFKKEK